MHAGGFESLGESIGSGPGVVLWRYREPAGGPVTNPFAEWAATMGEASVLYRRCFDVVRPPACRFPVGPFLQRMEGRRALILHDPEVFVDLVEVLPELAKACVGHNVRLVLVSEWDDLLQRCAKALEPLSETLPIEHVGAR